jgi:hypothetical protein
MYYINKSYKSSYALMAIASWQNPPVIFFSLLIFMAHSLDMSIIANNNTTLNSVKFCCLKVLIMAEKNAIRITAEDNIIPCTKPKYKSHILFQVILWILENPFATIKFKTPKL